MVRRAKATGRRGSWLAEVDGESYPCVHKHWFRGGRYDDPELRPGDSRSEELVAILRQKNAAVLTDDAVTEQDGGPLGFKRLGYIALWSVDSIEFDSAGLRFRFTGRLAEL